MTKAKEPEAVEKIEEDAVRGKIGVRWKETTLLVIVVLFIALFAVFLFGKGGTPVKIIGEGDRAPAFSLPALDGKTVNLSDFRGRVVMVHFWATWCPPCVEEMPALEQLYRTLKGRDFEVLAVSVDEGGAPAVAPFMQRHGLTFPALLDPERSASSLYGTFRFPETYVIDRDGVVRLKAVGSLDWTVPANRERLREIIEKR